MKLKIALATATAMGLAIGTAWANDGNKVFLDQDGTENSGSINQSGGDNNEFGLSTDSAKQIGTGNIATYNNSGWTGSTGNNNNVVQDFLQDGTLNKFQGSDVGGSTGNTLGSFTQDGDYNGAYVNRIQEDNSSVGTVLMQGNKNTLTIIQGDSGGAYAGGGNSVGSVSIIGSDNGLGSANAYLHAHANAAVYIQQKGNSNEVGSSTIDGSNNRDPLPFSVGAFNRVHEIIQTGNDNLVTAASTTGSVGNWIRLSQVGDENGLAGLGQLSTGFANSIGGAVDRSAIQVGTGNKIGFGALGNANQFGFFQNGANNSAIGLNFTGNNNEIGVEQAGTDNVVNLGAVVGDSNDIGVRQLDGGNTANIDLTNGSDFNAIRVIQDAAIAATNSNTADIDVNGDSNLLNVAQTGDNAMTVNVTGSGNNNTGGNFTGMADGVAGTSLNPGDLFQNGSSTATLTVGGGGASNNNLFAFNQDGAGNSIVGTIDGAAGGNQVAVAQVGSTNTANFSQNGAGNNLGISQ